MLSTSMPPTSPASLAQASTSHSPSGSVSRSWARTTSPRSAVCGTWSLSGSRAVARIRSCSSRARGSTSELLLLLLRRRRQQFVEPEVVGELAVVVGPVVHRDEHRLCPGELAGAEQLHLAAQIRVVHLGERGAAEVEGLLESRHQLVLPCRRLHLVPLGRRRPADLGTKEVVALRQVVNHVREAHLRRGGLVAVLGGGHLLRRRDEMARGALLALAEGIGDGGSLRRG